MIADNNVGSLVNHSLTVPVDPANNNHIKIENDYKNALMDMENVNKFGVPIAAAGIAGLGLAAIGGGFMVGGSTGNKNSQEAFDAEKKLAKELHLRGGQDSATYKTSGFNKIKDDFSKNHFIRSFDDNNYPNNLSPVQSLQPQTLYRVDQYIDHSNGKVFSVNKTQDGKYRVADQANPLYYLKKPIGYSSRRDYIESVNNDETKEKIIER